MTDLKLPACKQSPTRYAFFPFSTNGDEIYPTEEMTESHSISCLLPFESTTMIDLSLASAGLVSKQATQKYISIEHITKL